MSSPSQYGPSFDAVATGDAFTLTVVVEVEEQPDELTVTI
jgi:hypothetical protein